MKRYGEIDRVFMIGIGGSGMSGIAEILHNMGYRVRGSDINLNSETVKYLKNLGIEVLRGHKKENIRDEQVVVYSSAIRLNNPELIAAKEKKILILRRAEMLSELMRLKFGIAISGSHGKTTTTSMLGQILEVSKFQPTVVVGGIVKNFGTSAKVGKGNLMVVEADESDGTFLKFSPAVSIITNIDREHLDHYGTFTKLKKAFVKFANSVPFYGISVLSSDDKVSKSIIKDIKRIVKTFGFSEHSNIRGEIINKEASSFKVFYNGEEQGTINLKVAGKHNIMNALAATTAACYLKIPFTTIKKALEEFEGVGRRYDVKYENDITVVEDYGHHPTEIKANLDIASLKKRDRLIVVFQPHRYSRTKILLKSFPEAFKKADLIILTEIYSAGEDPIKGINSKLLFREFKNQGFDNIIFVKKREDIVDKLIQIKKTGDLIIFQGAGDIRNLIPEFIRRVK